MPALLLAQAFRNHGDYATLPGWALLTLMILCFGTAVGLVALLIYTLLRR